MKPHGANEAGGSQAPPPASTVGGGAGIPRAHHRSPGMHQGTQRVPPPKSRRAAPDVAWATDRPATTTTQMLLRMADSSVSLTGWYLSYQSSPSEGARRKTSGDWL